MLLFLLQQPLVLYTIRAGSRIVPERYIIEIGGGSPQATLHERHQGGYILPQRPCLLPLVLRVVTSQKLKSAIEILKVMSLRILL
jgi:hypothetical protein